MFFIGQKINYSRVTKQKLEIINFEIQVYDHRTSSQIKTKPESGCFINGIYLEGARWDVNLHYLVQPQPLELFSLLPPILLKAIAHQKDQNKIYKCPMYKTVIRQGMLDSTGHSTNYVMDLQLAIGKTNENWQQAGVASFLSLKH